MALVVQTGRTLNVKIATVSYDAQVRSVRLVPSQNTTQYTTLTSSAAIAGPVTWVLEAEVFQDWGAVGSFCDAMHTAAVAGTAVAFELGLDGTGKFTGNIKPVYIEAGGPADEAMTVTVSWPVDGDVTKS